MVEEERRSEMEPLDADRKVDNKVAVVVVVDADVAVVVGTRGESQRMEN